MSQEQKVNGIDTTEVIIVAAPAESIVNVPSTETLVVEPSTTLFSFFSKRSSSFKRNALPNLKKKTKIPTKWIVMVLMAVVVALGIGLGVALTRNVATPTPINVSTNNTKEVIPQTSGSILMVTDSSGRMHSIDTESWVVTNTLSEHIPVLYQMMVNENWMVTLDTNYTLTLYDYPSLSPLWSMYDISAVDMQQTIMVARNAGYVVHYNHKGELLDEIISNKTLTKLIYVEEEKMVFGTTYSEEMLVWDLVTGSVASTEGIYDMHREGTRIRVTTTEGLGFLGTNTETLTAWIPVDLSNKSIIASLADDKTQKLILAMRSGELHLMDLVSKTTIIFVQAHAADTLQSLTSVKDVVVSCGSDGALRVWSWSLELIHQVPLSPQSGCVSMEMLEREDAEVVVQGWRTMEVSRSVPVIESTRDIEDDNDDDEEDEESDPQWTDDEDEETEDDSYEEEDDQEDPLVAPSEDSYIPESDELPEPLEPSNYPVDSDEATYGPVEQDIPRNPTKLLE